MTYFRLDQGNQEQLILDPGVHRDYFRDAALKHPWEPFDVYDNRLNTYMSELFDVLPEKSSTDTTDELWLELTRGQKLFFSMLCFEGDLDNGGISQFFWNKEEHVYAVEEMLREIGDQRLHADYQVVLSHYEQVKDQIRLLKDRVDPSTDDAMDEFMEATEAVDTLFAEHSQLQEYFCQDEFKMEFYQKICAYIESRPEQFIQV